MDVSRAERPDGLFEEQWAFTASKYVFRGQNDTLE